MERIFYKKWTSILFVVAILVVVLLLCLLLTNLVQLSALNDRVETLQGLIDDARAKGEATEELLEFLKSDDYVRQWAEQQGRLDKDDIVWLKDNT